MSVMGVRVDLVLEDLFAVLTRIADALDRIADAMEDEEDGAE